MAGNTSSEGKTYSKIDFGQSMAWISVSLVIFLSAVPSVYTYDQPWAAEVLCVTRLHPSNLLDEQYHGQGLPALQLVGFSSGGSIA